MKLVLAVAAAIIILTSCVRPPEEALNTLENIGITHEGEISHECVQKQLAVISDDIDELDLEDSLKLTAVGHNIKKIILTNEKSISTNCKRILLEGDDDTLDKKCDPKTKTGEAETLSHTNIKLTEDTLELITFSQSSEITSIIYDLDDELSDTILSDVFTRTQNEDYIDIAVFEEVSSIQGALALETVTTTEKTSCGEPISVKSIIEFVNDAN